MPIIDALLSQPAGALVALSAGTIAVLLMMRTRRGRGSRSSN